MKNMNGNSITVLREIAHCMGAWKYGWPTRGQRRAVVRYGLWQCADGRWRWTRYYVICDGLTAHSPDWMKRLPCGGVHNKVVNAWELGARYYRLIA